MSNYTKMSKEQLINLLKQRDELLNKIQNRLEVVERKLADSALSKRITNIEHNGYRQQQYGQRECIEIIGLPGNLSQEALEEKVVNVFQHGGMDENKRDIHAIHSLKKN